MKGWLAAVTLCVAAQAGHALPSYDEVRQGYRPSDALLLDRHGEVIHRLRTDAGVRRGQWVPLAEVSPALRMAILMSEDKRFYEHSGVDWRAVSAAAWGNLWNTRTRGASTISMQLAGLLDEDLKQAPGGRSVAQKLGQTVAAQMLDRRWRKDQILEAYLNLVPFRGETVGVDALSRTLFGKAAHGLDEAEAALAAALVRAPNARPQLIAQRACGVLQALRAPAAVDCPALGLFVGAALQRKAFEPSEGIAPHLARRLLAASDQGPGKPAAVHASSARSAVRSTLRADLQRFARQSLGRHLGELRGRNVHDGAILVLDNRSGEVLAWVGSSGALSAAAEVDGVTAQRQPGSTLKPFLYAQALAHKRLTAASLLDDSPAHIATASGLYIPQNYDRRFKGHVSVRSALGASLNVPAVRALVMISPDAFARQLQSAGLHLKEAGDYYGYSLALGSAEVSLLHLTNAYRTLANGGRHSPPAWVPGAKPVYTQAIDAGAAYIVGDILADNNARTLTFGTDSLLATRFWTAVKTGTSKDMRDNWAVGWSERFTVGVWVGNAAGEPMHDVSGTSGAAPVWAAVMQHLHRQLPSRAPAPPAGITQQVVDFAGHEAGRREWFLRGTEQRQFAIINEANYKEETFATGLFDSNSSEKGSAGARITEPPTGTIIALDPDIPPRHQRLRLAAQGQALRWRVDGQDIAQGNQAQWMPWPGRHVVQIADAKGRVLDEIRIEVRGAGLKANAAGGKDFSYPGLRAIKNSTQPEPATNASIVKPAR